MRCLGAADVATAFDFARTHELEVAVRGAVTTLRDTASRRRAVIDLSPMRGVDVDARQIAHAQGGATWLDFDSATQAFGLVTPGGVVGSTGVSGLTLGGGIGHLTAQHGLTCDNIVGAELVTPSGSSSKRVRGERGAALGTSRRQAATSAWPRDSTSDSIRSTASWVALSSFEAKGPAMPSAASGTSFPALHVTSAVKR